MSYSLAAMKAAKAIWIDLSGRKGIDDELDQIELDIKQDILEAHAAIIDKHLNSKKEPKQS